MQHQVGDDAPVRRLRRGTRRRPRARSRASAASANHRSTANSVRPIEPNGTRPELDLAPRQALAEQRPDADADREDREQQRDDVLVAAQHVLGEVRELREEHRAVEPEPRDAEHRQPHDAVAAREAEVAPGLGERIPVDREVGRDRRRDAECRGSTSQPATATAIAAAAAPAPVRRRHRDQQAAGDRAEQDRDERAHLDQAVAADQLLGLQVLRQDRVLHRAEQRRVHAHQRTARRSSSDRLLQPEPDGADHHDRDLEDLDVADEARLLELVGELPGRRREAGRTAG